jgi:glycosyltransferase involved in cell wall biosynthesis
MRRAPSVAIVSYRLGGPDGVSREAAKWAWALRQLGLELYTVAGEGRADRIVEGLDAWSQAEPQPEAIDSALRDADLVIVENVCSLPLKPAATKRMADALRGRPAILHHHDLAWQRGHLSHFGAPPDDPSWVHVTINELSRHQLAQAGIEAVTIYNHFDPCPLPGRRQHTRQLLGLGPNDRLVLQPTRAIARKNVEGGLRVAEVLGATYWLTGPAEEGYGPQLDQLLSRATTRVLRGLENSMPSISLADAYAACDLVVLPSHWEGFGNPALESAAFRRALAIGRYPVAEELRRFGFVWLDAWDIDSLPESLASWSEQAEELNLAILKSHFSLDQLPGKLSQLVSRCLGSDIRPRTTRELRPAE